MIDRVTRSKPKVVQGSTNRDYAGSVIYENGSLKRILVEGGYIEGGVYCFYLNDHLGNTRMVANASGTAIQRDHYYPFGLPMAETSNTEQNKQPYKYNGKEFERKDGLNWMDYGARNYDAAVGRFTTMDPMAEKYYGVIPYAYCLNNPLIHVDPTGKAPYRYNWYSEKYEDNKGNVVEFEIVKKWLLGAFNSIGTAFKRMDSKFSLQKKALKEDVVRTLDFATGTGSEYVNLRDDHASTISLKESYMTTIALKKFFEEYKSNPSKSTYYVKMKFSPFESADVGVFESLRNDLGYSTAQFVGSCSYTFRVVGDELKVYVNNRKSLWSASYHIPFVGTPSRGETPLGIGRNTYQSFQFSMPLNDAKKHAIN
ncbi:RHS repeat-associated core domain-containing protein [Bacteroides sp. OttesenSCG-928-D19]|nr:RHS repeat-associated core domain-containing protein [Bacteroides sp. OttesenSCG-928-D19]